MTSALEDRLVRLEILATHLQRDVEQQNAAILAQEKEIRELRAALGRLHRSVESLREPPDSRDPLAEMPPHH